MEGGDVVDSIFLTRIDTIHSDHGFKLDSYNSGTQRQLGLKVPMIGFAFLSITALPAYIKVFAWISFLRTENVYFVLFALHIRPVVICNTA